MLTVSVEDATLWALECAIDRIAEPNLTSRVPSLLSRVLHAPPLHGLQNYSPLP
jgi:hypothetical protein